MRATPVSRPLWRLKVFVRTGCARLGKVSARLVLFLVLATSLRAVAQDNVCRNDGSGRDAYICAAQETRAADAELNVAYQHALSELDGSDNLRAARASLVESERAWIKFRDADCAVEADIFKGGSMNGAMVEACKKSLTEQRTKELRAIWLP